MAVPWDHNVKWNNSSHNLKYCLVSLTWETQNINKGNRRDKKKKGGRFCTNGKKIDVRESKWIKDLRCVTYTYQLFKGV